MRRSVVRLRSRRELGVLLRVRHSERRVGEGRRRDGVALGVGVKERARGVVAVLVLARKLRGSGVAWRGERGMKQVSEPTLEE